EHWEELVEEFYGYLKGGSRGHGNAIYRTVQYKSGFFQLKESYRRFMPMGGFLLVIIIGPILDLLYKTTDLELKQKGLNAVTEKIECLLDDILHYHERNERPEKKQ
ncbi:hypothetical protein OESDEN_17253, partial [Oesophagostomum dentatum]